MDGDSIQTDSQRSRHELAEMLATNDKKKKIILPVRLYWE